MDPLWKTLSTLNLTEEKKTDTPRKTVWSAWDVDLERTKDKEMERKFLQRSFMIYDVQM
jgi:hypothetical protein